MKKALRIKKHSEFDLIIKNGKKLKSKNFSIYYQAAPIDQDFTRIGLAIGKANGHAVTRVREKRQVRAMLASRNDYSLPVNIIITIHPCYRGDEFQNNERELNSLLDNVKEKIN